MVLLLAGEYVVANFYKPVSLSARRVFFYTFVQTPALYYNAKAPESHTDDPNDTIPPARNSTGM